MSGDQIEDTGRDWTGDEGPEDAPAEFIKVKVVGDNQNEVYFKLKKTTRFLKLKQCYSDNVGIPVQALKFNFDGERINDDDTPEKLNMEEDDQIEVYYSQIGGWQVRSEKSLLSSDWE